MKTFLSLGAACVVAVGCTQPAKACPPVAVSSFSSLGVVCPSVAVQSFAFAQPQVQVQTFALQQQVVQAQAVAFAPVAVQAFAVQSVCAQGGCVSARGGRPGILGRVLGNRSRSVSRAVSVQRN